jgi:hypothetical protein
MWVYPTLLVPSQDPGELSARVLLCVAMVVVLLLFSRSPPGMVPACSFYRLKEVQGYKMLACGVEPGGLRRALSGGDVVRTMEAWSRYFWHCCYVSRHVDHC